MRHLPSRRARATATPGSAPRRHGGAARYRELKGRYQADAIQEATLNQIGYTLLTLSRPADAVEVFKLNAEVYPGSWNVYDNLGEGYAAVGDVPKAVASYDNATRKLGEQRRRL